MVNIGEISKPGIGVSPVKPRRSASDSELTTPADDIGATVKVSSQIYPKNRKESKKKNTPDGSESAETKEDQSASSESEEDTSAADEISCDDASYDDISYDDISYDENGNQSHHGKIDLNA